MVFNGELFVEKVLDLLWFPWLTLSQEFEQLFLLVLAELRGAAASEVQREESETALVPATTS